MNPIEELLIKTQMVDKELAALKKTVQNLSEEVRENEKLNIVLMVQSY